MKVSLSCQLHLVSSYKVQLSKKKKFSSFHTCIVTSNQEVFFYLIAEQLHIFALSVYIPYTHTDPDSWQWKAVSTGQAAGSSKRKGQPSSHLFPDGQNVGHPWRVHAT